MQRKSTVAETINKIGLQVGKMRKAALEAEKKEYENVSKVSSKSSRKKTHDFLADLKRGKVGEHLFLKLHPEYERLDGRHADFKTIDGDLIELKTDMHDAETTPNFFFEHKSNQTKGTMGGPFRALDEDIGIYVYFFPHNKTAYFFDTERLVNKLLSLRNLKEKEVKNKGYITTGYAVRREIVKSALIEIRRYYGEEKEFKLAGF